MPTLNSDTTLYDNIPLLKNISAELTTQELALSTELKHLLFEIQTFLHLPTDIKLPYIMHLTALIDNLLMHYVAQSSLVMKETDLQEIYQMVSELTCFLPPDSIMKNILLCVIFDSYLKSHTNALSAVYKCHLIDGILVISHSSHSKKRIINNSFSGLVSFKEMRHFVKQEVNAYKNIISTKIQN